MEPGTMISAGAALQTPKDIVSAPIHPITWPMSCFSPAKPSGTYQGSVLATSLTPGAEIWAARHHQWKSQGGEDQAANGHDDSGISPGRTSSSGPSSVGGSPPAAKTAEPGSSALPIKEEQPDKEQAMSLHEESSISSEDVGGDLYGRTSQSNSPTGHLMRCPMCGNQEFTSIALLLQHCQQSHSDEAPVTSSLNCSVCSLASASKEAFVVHLASHLPQQHQCLVCGFSTKSQDKLNEHLAEVHGVDPAESNAEITTRAPSGHGNKAKIFKCKQCPFVAHTKLDFWAHSKAHIKGDKVLACPRCPFVTEYKHHLEYHLRNHSGSKPFKCPQCTYTCVNKSMLNSHLKSHSNVYQYRCSDCNYVTKYCHSLKLHLRKYMHTPAMVLNPDGSPNPLPIIDVYGTRRGPKLKKEQTEQAAPANMNMFKCPQCDFWTPSEQHYQQHLLSTHLPVHTPQQQHQQPAQMQQPAVNPLKEYLSWIYTQQVSLMQHFNATAALNPLDLSKESPPPPPPPATSPPSKNRRKGKAFRLEQQFETEKVAPIVQPEPMHQDEVEEEEELLEVSETEPPKDKARVQDQMLHCMYCDIFFKDAVMYAMHMGYHGFKDPFHCNMCGEKSEDKLSFFLHIARSSHL